MNHLDPAKTGRAVGAFFATLHVIWVLLVALGWAGPLVNFSAWAHMMTPPVEVGAFDLTAAITVIVVAAIVGWLIGTIFAHVWNRTHR